jgi:hypothetical protein
MFAFIRFLLDRERALLALPVTLFTMLGRELKPARGRTMPF